MTQVTNTSQCANGMEVARQMEICNKKESLERDTRNAETANSLYEESLTYSIHYPRPKGILKKCPVCRHKVKSTYYATRLEKEHTVTGLWLSTCSECGYRLVEAVTLEVVMNY